MAEPIPTHDARGEPYSFREKILIRTVYESADEITRLRGWLDYIASNFRNGPECAREALAGDPWPEGFSPSPNDI